MKASEIRQMSVNEMNEQLTSLKEELFNLRFQLAVTQGCKEGYCTHQDNSA